VSQGERISMTTERHRDIELTAEAAIAKLKKLLS